MPARYKRIQRAPLPKRPVTDNVREQIEAALNRGDTEGSITSALAVSRRTVQRFRKNLRNHGSSRPVDPPRKRGPKSVITDEMADVLARELEARPNVGLEELGAMLKENWGVDVNRSTVWHALKRRGVAREGRGRKKVNEARNCWGVCGGGLLAEAMALGLARDAGNLVLLVVRGGSRAEVEARVSAQALENVTVLDADLDDRIALGAASRRLGDSTGGKLDGLVVCDGTESDWKGIEHYETETDRLDHELQLALTTHTMGTYKIVSTMLPLLRKGKLKKVCYVSSSFADFDFTSQLHLGAQIAFSASKAAANMVISKFNAAYAREGILFFAISPGFVDASDKPLSAEEIALAQPTIQAYAQYAPHFIGPLSPEASATMCLKVIEEATLEKGYGGAFLSHYGTRQWL